MKPLLLALIVVLSAQGVEQVGQLCVHAAQLAAQEPGNPEHKNPGPGTYCTPKGWFKNGKQTPDAPCACHAVATKESSCEERTEDVACKVYCFKSSCACPSKECK